MHKKPLAPLATCLALAFAQPAGAETSPWYIGAAQVFTYQNNIYSSASGEIDSAISTTNLVGGFDQPIGRQRVYGSATVGYNYYFNEAVRQLNYTSYGINVGMDWETVERLSGTVRLAANQGLANYATAEAPEITERNIQNLGLGALTARYGITPRIALDAGYEYRKLDYSAPAYANQEYSQNVYTLGLRYGQSGALSLGVGLRLAKADYPFYQPIYQLGPDGNPVLVDGQPIIIGYAADESTGKYVDFFGSWTPSGLSTLDVRLSLSDISHTLNQGSDFNGLTGAIGWNYQPTGKITTRVSLVVAPGTGSTFYAFTGGPTLVENSTLNGTLRLSATYAATGKTSMNGFVALSRNRYGQVTPTGTEYGTDLTTFVGLGVTYLPTRNITLGCSMNYTTRSASQEAIALGQSYDYSGSSVSCSGQIVLQ